MPVGRRIVLAVGPHGRSLLAGRGHHNPLVLLPDVRRSAYPCRELSHDEALGGILGAARSGLHLSEGMLWRLGGRLQHGQETSDLGATSWPLLWTAYVYYNCRLVAQIANSLGQPQDAAHFRATAEKVGAAFNRAFFDPQSNTYTNKTQTSYVLPLAFGLVPPEHRQAVADNLVKDILVEHTGHLSVGCVGMKWLMQTLTEIGRTDVAYTILTQTTRPSWGYMVSQGRHLDLGALGPRHPRPRYEWTEPDDPRGLSGGLDVSIPGRHQLRSGATWFQTHNLRPQPVGDLTFVNGSYKSMHGTIISHWKIEGGKFHWQVTIPPNTTATVTIPTKDAATVTEGGKPANEAEVVRFLRTSRRRPCTRSAREPTSSRRLGVPLTMPWHRFRRMRIPMAVHWPDTAWMPRTRALCFATAMGQTGATTSALPTPAPPLPPPSLGLASGESSRERRTGR